MRTAEDYESGGSTKIQDDQLKLKYPVDSTLVTHAIKELQLPHLHDENGGILVPSNLVTLMDPTANPVRIGGAPSLLNMTSLEYEAQRTPNKFGGSATITTIGDTALWTPAAGKRFRLLGIVIVLSSIATTAAGSTLSIKDGATAIMAIDRAETTNNGHVIHLIFSGNGYLSSAAGAVLNANLTAALTAGNYSISFWGTEE